MVIVGLGDIMVIVILAGIIIVDAVFIMLIKSDSSFYCSRDR